MILVTLGTQDKEFTRLLKAIDREIDNGNIKDEVIVQAGFTKYKSNNMKIFDLIEPDEFEKLIRDCDLLITHGGVGSILSGISNHKKVIAAARLKKYKEHTNDHQKQIVEEFVNRGYILELKDFDKLAEVIKQAETFKPKELKSNNKKFVKLIEDYIDDNQNISWYNKFRNLSSYGYNGIILSLINVWVLGLLFSKVNLYLNVIYSFIITLGISLIFNLINDVKIKNIKFFSILKLFSLIIYLILVFIFNKIINLPLIFIINLIVMLLDYILIKKCFNDNSL
jgi:UDP-N-acetylglucosamine transferase subunit ALG13